MRCANRLDSVTAIVAKRAREFVLNSVGCSTETVTGALLDRVVGVMDYPQHSQSCGAVSLYLGMVWVLAAAPVHEPVMFDLDEPDWGLFQHFHEKLQETIKKSPEFAMAAGNAPLHEDAPF